MATVKRLSRAEKVNALREVKKILRRRGGWIKGEYRDRKGGYCLAGAAGKALIDLGLVEVPEGRDPYAYDFTDICYVGAPRLFGRQPVPFNDKNKTKKKDVLEYVDNRIEALSA